MTDLANKGKRVAGGAATGGGINFQAAVSAITYVYMARGQQLSWLEKVADDVPVAVDAETGGAGDDIRLLLKTGEIVEAQVKKGLRAGRKLWDALVSLATAINAGKINYGLLIVSPTSSNTITEELAKTIRRLGDGRLDNLSQIARQFIAELKALNLPIVESCKYIRIQTINALIENQSNILAARGELSHLCADQAQVIAAWNSLYKDATDLIENRGRRDVSSVLRVLNSEGIKLVENDSTTPVLLLDKLSRWTFATHKEFSIFGVNKPLRTDEAWIPLKAVVQQTLPEFESLADALENYQTWDVRSVNHDVVTVNPETLARFIKCTILIGGPGMGKTTLLNRIARRYSEDHIPVLHVRLNSVATRMRAGNSFEEAVFELGLDGSGITASVARKAALPNWLLLCDGLDECGKLQEDVAAGVGRFAAGHSDCRILITTRPVGYYATHFSYWRHYYLAPLEPSLASVNLSKLVFECAEEGSPFRYDTYTLCSTELERNESSKVVTRNPLILGLAASIIVRGGHLGATQEHLFEQIFQLIDEVPNFRILEPPSPPALLRRFLDILGWHITTHPLSRIGETLDRCTEELACETGNPPLKVRIDAESCLRYWQNIGMIEKIGHGSEETLVFIHKSFGEFAAARHLRAMTPEKQQAIIISIVDDQEWAEVIRYAAFLGLGNIIGNLLISSEAAGAKGTKRTALATELISAATPPPEQSLRERIIGEAFKIVSSVRRREALKIGEYLVNAARRFPREIGPLAGELLHHEQPWTYIVGWAVVVAAGTDYYRLDNLADAMRRCIDLTGPSMGASLGGGVILGGSGERDLVQSFVLDAASVLLDQNQTDLTDSAIDCLNSPNLGSMDFLQKAQKLLRARGRIEDAEKLAKEDNWSVTVPTPGYRKAQLIAYEAIFDALDLPATIVENDNSPGVLLHLSAFLAASKFWEIPASDIWAWTCQFDKVATNETLKGFIGVCGIDAELLRNDAQLAKSYLLASEENEGWRRLYRITTRVDPPSTDWVLAPALELDTAYIEAALFHPSQWIVWLAANLIENLLPPQELKMAVQRLFKTGKGYTLWAACGLTEKLTQDQAVEIVFERLSAPLVRGCEYLFKLLQQFDLQWEANLGDMLCKGLKGDKYIAEEAARFIANIAKPGQTDLATIINDAFTYWIVNEKPYPNKNGIVPHSPRAKLVEALMKIKEPTYIELRTYATDQRSDVKDVATGKILDWLRLPDGPRVQFLNDICSEVLPSNLLSKALEKMVPLNLEELELWEGLLSSKNPKIRFNAMSLLDKGNLDSASVRVHARAMTDDNEQQIRDRAYRILDML